MTFPDLKRVKRTNIIKRPRSGLHKRSRVGHRETNDVGRGVVGGEGFRGPEARIEEEDADDAAEPVEDPDQEARVEKPVVEPVEDFDVAGLVGVSLDVWI